MDEQHNLIVPVRDSSMELELGFTNGCDATNDGLDLYAQLSPDLVECVNNIGSVGGPKAPLNVQYTRTLWRWYGKWYL